jgi:ABC-type branched-subunit amino acid transport system ATPase component/branched-subunit amino acid ABC-type transport system permease component
MNALLPFIIIGITSGSVYGLAGVGLVLTYKTSGVFNFAQGAIGTAAAFLFYTLHYQHGMPWPLAALICLGVFGPLTGLVFEAFAGKLSRTTLALAIAATVGALLAIVATLTLIYGSATEMFPSFLPTKTFSIGGVNVGYDKLIITVISFGATAALYLFFRSTRMGRAMQAVVYDAELLDLAGTSPTLVRRLAWTIGCTFAVLSGLLLAPSVSLDPLTLTLLVIQAFGAAAIGGFSNLPLTWLGGLAIGVGSSVLTKYISSTSILGGIPASLPFIVLFVVTLVYPRAKLAFRPSSVQKAFIPWRFPGRIQIVIALGVAAALLAVPGFAGFHLSDWTASLTNVILLLSLGLLVRTSGQVSLGQIGFAAIGAVAFSKLAVDAHWPWLLALLVGALIAIPVGAILALPAIRLNGLYLALATLGFALILQDMFYQSNLMFGVTNTGILMPMPHLSWLSVDSGTGFYYVVLAFTAAACLIVVGLTRSRLGRLMKALSDSPTALLVGGTSINLTRLLVFCISAYMAAIAGALSGMVVSVVTGTNYDPFTSLTYLALVLVVAGGEPWFAIIGGLGLGLVPAYVSGGNVNSYLQLVFGIAAILTALGIAGKLPDSVRQFFERLAPPRAGKGSLAAGAPAEPVRSTDNASLKVKDLRMQFGGLIAVDQLSLTAEPGRITALIGPNGSGKTTTLNACSGLIRPRSGSVALSSVELSRLSPAGRARRGLGRTFQLMQLYDSQTVWENVMMGREAWQAGAGVRAQLFARRSERAIARVAAQKAVELCGIADLAQRQVATLSTGQRRLVELARCLAGPFDVLLLDEPSSGLDHAETERLGVLLREVVAARGVAILLVEHDMSLVLGICHDIYVMDSGALLFHGGPKEVRESPAVQAAYLGSEVSRLDTSRPQPAKPSPGPAVTPHGVANEAQA